MEDLQPTGAAKTPAVPTEKDKEKEKAKYIKSRKKELEEALAILEKAKRDRADAEVIVRAKTIETNKLRAELVDMM